jgi:hypothetical protein
VTCQHPQVSGQRWIPIGVAVVVVALLAAVVLSSLGGDDHHTNDTSGDLPAVGHGIPSDYRILYSVVTPDGTTSEEHLVHRPFDAQTITRDANGRVTSQRWSSLGRVVTRGLGSGTVRLDTAIALADGDSRPDVLDTALVEVKRLTATGKGEVGGRPCTKTAQTTKVATAGNGQASISSGGTLPVVITTCVDAQGLVLEQRYTTVASGEPVLTKRALELEVGRHVPDVHVPSARVVPVAQGGGQVRKVATDHAIPFDQRFHLPAPRGWTFVGRYHVVPARLSTSGAPAGGPPGISLYTDVWRRGPDVLLLDQGAQDTGTPPFDATSRLGPITVPGLGSADLAVDTRLAEIRFTLPSGGFARLAGTLAPKDLLALAETLTLSST